MGVFQCRVWAVCPEHLRRTSKVTQNRTGIYPMEIIPQIRHAKSLRQPEAGILDIPEKLGEFFIYLPSGFAMSDMNGKWVSGKKSLSPALENVI